MANCITINKQVGEKVEYIVIDFLISDTRGEGPQKFVGGKN